MATTTTPRAAHGAPAPAASAAASTEPIRRKLFIKTVTIQGFKSYRDQTRFEDFSEHQNVILGKNGSGKSTFFQAIEFVLSDTQSSLASEAREKLLHSDTGAPVMSAYVEIVFDNNENVFENLGDEVVLRRTIGAKKDEYSLNRRSIQKTELMNLLESIGLSRSNPYFIVPQNRVAEITTKTDLQRLELLKEIAGTSVYEEKRRDSLKILEETKSKREKIDEHLEQIDRRLNELEAEKQQLDEYQKLDRDRRCLEFAIYNHDLEETNQTIAKIEDTRQNETVLAHQHRHDLADAQKNIKENEEQLSALTLKLKQIEANRVREIEDRQALLVQRDTLINQIADLEAKQKEEQSSKTTGELQLRKLQNEVNNKQTELAQITTEYDSVREREQHHKERFTSLEARLEGLEGRMDRVGRFRNQGERDTWIRSELAKIGQNIEQQNKDVREAQKTLDNNQKSIVDKVHEVEKRQKELEKRRSYQKTATKEHSDLQVGFDSALENRKNQQRTLDDKREKLRVQSEKAEQKAQQLASSMNRDTANGLKSIEKLRELADLRGLYGPLYELFTVEHSKFEKAVDVVSGSTLFHVVVDSDVTAERALNEMKKRNLPGRVTFAPLNRLRYKEATFSGLQPEDGIPLIKKIKFNATYSRAIEQVFGGVIVCKDLEVGGRLSRDFNATCVTLDGRNRVSNKGELTGGYSDPTKLRYHDVIELKKLRQEVSDLEKQISDQATKLQAADQEVTMLRSQLGTSDTRQMELTAAVANIIQEIDLANKERIRLSDKAEQLVKQLEQAKDKLKAAQGPQAELQNELSTPFMNRLSQADQQAQQQLRSDIAQVMDEFTVAAQRRAELEIRRDTLSTELSLRLVPALEQLQSRLGEISTGGTSSELEDLQRQLKANNDRLEKRTATLDSLDEENLRVTSETQILETATSQLKEQCSNMEHQEQLRFLQRDKALSDRAYQFKRREELSQKIRELGSLPADFDRYRQLSQTQLERQHSDTLERLKQFSHVNKRALDQYRQFAESRDDLMRRKHELDESEGSINQLLETLDQKKDEAINFTFKQVAMNFARIFAGVFL